ncbi:MAG: sulfite exporter TauE/SafE family protein [Euryarchaeota archaeon]|nr:sulfite exporter TauE/SafE family protein [Euryarchaeota archaeon]
MSVSLTYIYLFPVGIIIAVLAISAGISGTNFWIPVYLIWLGIDAKTTFWLSLLTMIFGFGSGIIKNLKERTVNWYVVKDYLKIAVPSSILGTLFIPFAPVKILLIIFAGFIFIYGGYLIYHYWLCYCGNGPAERKSTDRICRERAALGGFLKGLIATGMGKLVMPCILRHKKIRSPAEAVGSTVLIIFVVNICALIFRLTPDFVSDLIVQKDLIFEIMIWVAPGVFIGGQIGPAIAQKLSVQGIKLYVGCLLMGVSVLIGLRAFGIC